MSFNSDKLGMPTGTTAEHLARGEVRNGETPIHHHHHVPRSKPQTLNLAVVPTPPTTG
ncbi:hypothetical protein APED_18240 [Acanthopleuribacter pedis]